MRQRVAFGVTALVATSLTLAMLSDAPAQAECLSVSVWVDRQSAPTTYLVGPDLCVVPTPFTPALIVDHDFQRDGTLLPPGSPSGAGERVSVPAP